MNSSPFKNGEIHTSIKREPLSPETIKALQELGEVFRQIHRRLVSEGYIFRNGEIIKPSANRDKNGADC